MAKSSRFVLTGVMGTNRQNWGWPGVITPFSNVFVTAGEIGVGSSEQAPPGAIGQNFHYHLGAASIWISNISPHHDGVEFLIHVDWSSPLDIAVTVTVDDAFPIFVQGYVTT